MEEIWRPIPGFPIYDINNLGEVYNTKTRSLMRIGCTNHGHARINLIDESGEQHTRSVAKLVADAFCEPPNSLCNQVIVLDGDLTNLRADNLAWRPTWFAWKYTRQLKEPQPDHFYNLAVANTDTGDIYDSIIEAGAEEGLLFQHIWESTYRGSGCFPYGHVFEVVERV